MSADSSGFRPMALPTSNDGRVSSQGSREAVQTRSPLSGTDDDEEEEAKRRRVQRACDLCRRKKIRCDGGSTKRSAKCSNCIEGKAECTYVEAAKRRGPPQGYIEALEFQVQRMENLIHRIDPGLSLNNELGPRINRETFNLASYKAEMAARGISYNPASGRGRQSSKGNSLAHSPHGTYTNHSSPTSGAPRDPKSIVMQERMLSLTTPEPKITAGDVKPAMVRTATDLEEERLDLRNMKLAEKLHDMRIADGYRFHGKSSGVQLLHAIMDMKYQDKAAEGADDDTQLERMGVGRSRRPQFWGVPSWEASINFGRTAPLDFEQWPAPDLAIKLMDAYFDQENNILPLFNRYIFQRDYDNERFRHDVLFAKVCLMLFANAARLVDDPRVFWWADDEAKQREALATDPAYKHSAGWRWLAVTLRMGKSFLAVPVLEDLQAYALLALFLLGSSSTSTAWAMAGLGLRACQDIGVHTRVGISRYAKKSERELHKRVFWVLVYIDRITCAGMGRTMSMQDVDFDIDYPVDVDDEYWETGNPNADFKQPADVPSRMSYFVTILKLTRIIGDVLKTVYAVNRQTLGFDWNDPTIQKELVADFDSAVNSWVDAVPTHLRWDPHQPDRRLFEQSCMLYSLVYTLQILIHRPFLPKPGKPVSQLGVASLAICTNAARSASHVADAHMSRGLLSNQHMHLATFTAAIVLLIGVWGQKRTNGGGDTSVALADIQKCLKSLKTSEVRWRQAGKLRDVLTELANMSEAPIATPSPLNISESTMTGKRARGPSNSASNHSSPSDYAAGSSSNSARQVKNVPNRYGTLPSAPISDVRGGDTRAAPASNEWFSSAGSGPQWTGTGNPPLAPYHPSPADSRPPSSASWNVQDFPSGPPNAQSYYPGAQAPTDSTSGVSAVMSPTSLHNLLNSDPAPMSFGSASNTANFDTSSLPMDGLLNMQDMPFGTVAAPDDINLTGWQFNAGDAVGNGNAIGQTGAIADIWSMAPWSFEMDDWSAYLRQAAPQQQ